MAESISIAIAKLDLDRATPSNLRLGTELAEQGYVELVKSEPDELVARVGGSPGASRRTVTYGRTADGDVVWGCTCRKVDSLWCKHACAVVIQVREVNPAS